MLKQHECTGSHVEENTISSLCEDVPFFLLHSTTTIIDSTTPAIIAAQAMEIPTAIPTYLFPLSPLPLNSSRRKVKANLSQ